MNLRSNSANSPSRRANWKALGLSHEDMEKPKIAVVNSSSELAICYAHLDGIAKMVKEEIRAAGGVPFEVRTAAPSDFITGANKGGSYILAGRDIIAMDRTIALAPIAKRPGLRWNFMALSRWWVPIERAPHLIETYLSQNLGCNDTENVVWWKPRGLGATNDESAQQFRQFAQPPR